MTTRTRKAPKPGAPQFDIDRAFLMDEKATIEGARIELAEGVAIYVARMNNPKYAEALLKFYRENKFAIERTLIDQNKADEKICRILAETIFVRIEGFFHDEKPLADTAEKRAWALLTYPALREKVVEESQNFSNYRAAELADEGKDSASASGGNSSTGDVSSSSET